MKFKVQILESTSQISTLILDEIKKIVEPAINKSLPDISKDVKALIADALRAQPEYTSLMAGTLRAEFGIEDIGSIGNVIEALIETLEIKKTNIGTSNKGLTGGFVLTMMKSDDMNGLIYTDLASVNDSEGYSLPWLEWLLFKGNEIIVKNYKVSYGSYPYSRSGMAIMVPSSESWRVPSDFAGVQNNNWTTRAINSVEDSVYKIIQHNIEKYL